MEHLLWLILVFPLAGSAAAGLLGPRWLKQHSHWPCIAGIVAACAVSFLVFFQVLAAEPHTATVHTYYTWFQAGKLDVGLSLRADALTAIMLVTVTFVGSLIAIYSTGYMHGDPGYPRFFAALSLFVFSMTGLVLADNFLVLFAFWEGVGLCSYLLIGFWFAKSSAAAAARKAFLVTRLGDLGFLLGIMLLWAQGGYSLNYEQVFQNLAQRPELVPLVCILLFCGAVGKSAQFPLHVWLPDAMEGPSPVSALIHAATMVTAGVYLVARCMPIFHLAPSVLLVVSAIGSITAILAAVIALSQNDLKRVLAYSTLSQLGYMFMALGCATTPELVPLAVVAAVFHLVTHAFFKALLFLAAGSVMHAMGNVIDMRRFGGLRSVLPTTHATFLCGALALAGFPLLSGFWSKDEILAVISQASAAGLPHAKWYGFFLVVGLVTAALTAFYTFRAYFMTFWGEERVPPEAGHHAHESPPVMTVPLVILAVGAVGLGIVVQPLTHWFSDLLTKTPGLHAIHDHGMNVGLMALSSLLAVGGIGFAWWMYVKDVGLADRVAAGMGGLYQLSVNLFYLNELYAIFVVMPMTALAVLSRLFDTYVLDGIVDLFGQVPSMVGQLFRPLQNGLVQFYALTMVLGLTVFLFALVLTLGG
jgi:NADH-quinone oxidoreductase subunit L